MRPCSRPSLVGNGVSMIDEQQSDDTQADEAGQSSTSPPGGKTHEATTPPGQGDRDEDAIRTSEEKLDQAGGGH